MDQQQVEAWIAQNGGNGAVQYTSEKKRIPNPAYPLTLPDGSANPQYAPGQPPTIETVSEMWVNSKTGAKLNVSRKDDGTFDVIENQSADPSKAASTETPAARRTAREEAEIAANAALPPDQDPRAETNAERAARADARIKEQGQAARQAQLDAETKAERERVAKRQEEADARAEAERNRGTTTLKPDGKGGTVAVTVFPDGRPPTTVAVSGVPSEAQAKYKEVKQDPATGKWSGMTPDGKWEEIQGGPGLPPDKSGYGVEPAGAPEMTYTAGQLSAGLRTYSSWLSGQVKLYNDTQGKQGVAPNDATKLMERRISLAESALKEQEGLGNAQKGLLDNATTQRGQSLTETQSRRGTAERLQTNALSTFVPLAEKLGPGGGKLLSDAINNTLAGGRSYVDSFGGLRESPEVNPDSFPALAELRRSSMAGIQTAAQGGPQIFGPQTVMTPPPVAAQTTGTPMPPATNPVSGTPILLPPTRPSTPAPPPVAPPANAQAAANAGLVPGQDPNVWTPPPANAQAAANAGPVPGQDAGVWSPPELQMTPEQMAASAAAAAASPQPNPSGTMEHTPLDYGQPGMRVLPQQTSQVGAMPVDAGAAGGNIEKAMPARFMQEQRYGPGNYFDPVQRSAELSQRLGIPPDIMQAALGSLYG